MRILNNFILVLLLFAFSAFSFASELILINHPESQEDSRYEYPKKLLTRILQITSDPYGAFILETNGVSMSRSRAMNAMIDGKKLHVMAEAPKPDWNEHLLCVRIPIRKGIQGYRIFLTKNEHKAKLDAITTLDEFKLLPTGSGEQWSTTRVMEEAGFNVVRGVDYEGLFGMLERNRFITFGRGINEAFVELEERRSKIKDLMVDERFLLYIPLPTYFYVTPTKPLLKERIELGMKKLISSGEFERIFQQEFGPMIEKAKLDKRILFSIPNPNLTEEDQLDVKEYWYKPGSKST